MKVADQSHRKWAGCFSNGRIKSKPHLPVWVGQAIHSLIHPDSYIIIGHSANIDGAPLSVPGSVLCPEATVMSESELDPHSPEFTSALLSVQTSF